MVSLTKVVRIIIVWQCSPRIYVLSPVLISTYLFIDMNIGEIPKVERHKKLTVYKDC